MGIAETERLDTSVYGSDLMVQSALEDSHATEHEMSLSGVLHRAGVVDVKDVHWMTAIEKRPGGETCPRRTAQTQSSQPLSRAYT